MEIGPNGAWPEAKPVRARRRIRVFLGSRAGRAGDGGQGGGALVGFCVRLSCHECRDSLFEVSAHQRLTLPFRCQ